MSFFPFNYDRIVFPARPLGSPVTYEDMFRLAEKIYTWHLINRTTDLSEQSDAAQRDIIHIAVGLVALLANPGMLTMIESIGMVAIEDITLAKHLTKRDNEDGEALKRVLFDAGLLK